MPTIRRSEERGRTRLDWLDSRHSFSFGDYHDPAHMGFRSLRVLNQDVVAPGAGFGPHPHRDAEILTLVLEGALEHRDSEGSRGILRAGDVQRMSAGRGIVHSEMNASGDEPVHFLQIWIEPEARGLAPSYQEAREPFAGREGVLEVVASHGGRDGGLSLHQDALVLAGRFAEGSELAPGLADERHAWLQVVTGRLRLDDAELRAGDAVSARGSEPLVFRVDEAAELLLFDLA